MSDFFQTQQSKTLSKAVSRAQEALEEARDNHHRSLPVGADTDVNVDGKLALRKSGQAYAHAVTEYSTAVMAWLMYIESNTRDQSE